MPRKSLPSLPTDPFECLAQGCERPWEVAVDPFEVAPGTFYVGNNWVGAYLLITSDGLILIDTTMQPQVYIVIENIRKLGYDPEKISHILISHMHYDHIGGTRVLQEISNAKVFMSREDWDFMQTQPEQIFTGGYPCGPFEPDGFYDDDKPINVGNRSIRTLLTPGHTPGTTSFFFDAVHADGTRLHCGMHGGVGLNTLSDAFLDEHNMPRSARDQYLESMKRVRNMPIDITLGSHPAQVGMMEKVDAITTSNNPFLDPTIWPRFIDGRIAQITALMENA